jgi:hypothetical protein
VSRATGGPTGSTMANRDIVATGTSAGGVEVLLFAKFLAKGFQHGFPASMLVTSWSRRELQKETDVIWDAIKRLDRMAAQPKEA